MIALINAMIYTMAGTIYEKGTVLVDDHGKIAAVEQSVEIPSTAHVVDCGGKVITPGLIDAHTHLGVYEEGIAWAGEDVNEKSDPVTPALHTLDAIHPGDIGLKEAYQNGVTTVMIAPGSANAIGGQCVIAKTKPRATVEEMIIREKAGLKIAFGENPKRCYGAQQNKKPLTRMATACLIRETFMKGLQYIKDRESGKVSPDLALEAIARVLRREMPVRAHAHRSDDIVTAVRIAKEFSIDLIIEHGTESYMVADLLQRNQIPVIVGPTLTTRSKLELKDKNMATPAELKKAGVLFAMMSDHPVIPSCFLSIYAGLATRFGLANDEALAMITSNAAKILQLSDRVGTLAPGMDADLVVWSGHPFQLSSKVEFVMVDGVLEKI
ncbi:MAG: amidohydrolase [Sporomusaceae bacterium]|nr:amidohydrolase [Sporomusaceae bacterium]